MGFGPGMAMKDFISNLRVPGIGLGAGSEGRLYSTEGQRTHLGNY